MSQVGPAPPPTPEPRAGKVIFVDDIGQLIGSLLLKYHAGEIRGVVAIVANNRDTFEVCHAGKLSYVETLGLLTATIDTVNRVMPAEGWSVS